MRRPPHVIVPIQHGPRVALEANCSPRAAKSTFSAPRRIPDHAVDKNGYQELVEFIAPRFDEVFGRLTKLEVSFEQFRSDFRVLGEGLSVVREGLSDLGQKVDALGSSAGSS